MSRPEHSPPACTPEAASRDHRGGDPAPPGPELVEHLVAGVRAGVHPARVARLVEVANRLVLQLDAWPEAIQLGVVGHLDGEPAVARSSGRTTSRRSDRLPSALVARGVPRLRNPCKNAERSLHARDRRPTRCPRHPSSRSARGPGSARSTRRPRLRGASRGRRQAPPPAAVAVERGPCGACATGRRSRRRPRGGPAVARSWLLSTSGASPSASAASRRADPAGPSSANCSSATREPGAIFTASSRSACAAPAGSSCTQ